ncbi:hypothetical protein ACFY9N_00725 [Microbacterium sp. NPDC008134]|uniref:hypothetical protein n=1 Tax=Microbacterium sp. NPDC008134 TaxID=3364183 RepID=UPI0036EDEECB
MSDLNRREPNEPARQTPANDGLSEDYGDLGERRNRRIRIVSWVVIVALILGGGGATVLTLLFG